MTFCRASCLAVFLTGLLAGNAAAQQTDERQAATLALLQCLADHAARADDHTSDAATIATAIEQSCPQEQDRVVGAFSAGLSMQARSMLQDKVAASMHGMAVGIVLKERRPNSN